MPLDASLAADGRRRRSAPRSASTRSTRRPASTRSSTRTWPPPRACTPSSRASTCAASRCSRSAAPGRCTPAAWPSCSSPIAGRVPGQRQRAVGVRHARVAGAHRPRPLDAPPARRRRPGRARRAARRAARPRAAGCWPPPVLPDERSASATASTPATSGRATRSRCGSARATSTWPADDADVLARVRGRVPADLRADDPRRRHRGRHVAARRSSPTPTTFEPQAGPGRRRRRAERPPRRSRSTAAPTPVDTPVYRRPTLGAGDAFDGPAIVEERETTAVIRPGWTRRRSAADGHASMRTP